MLEKSSFRSTTLTVAVISFFGYIIGLTTGFDLFANICSPLCALMVGISIMTVAYAIPRFRICVSCIGIAAFFWFLGDVFYFLVYEMGMDVERFSMASERMYQFTSYMYAIGLVFFIRKEYKGKDVLRFVVHAMLLAICTNILIRTYLEYTNGIQLVVTEMSVYNLLIILVSFFIVIVTLMVIINRGVSNVSTFGVLIFISFLLYGICDNRYSFLSAIGVNAQNYVMDAVALFSVLLSGIAFCHPTIGKFLDENEKLIYRENDYVGETVAVVFTVVGFVMFITKIMPESSFAILFVTCLIYFLLSRSMQATELNKKLLALQEAENARLQQEVVDKQNELMSTNEQLENAMYLDSLSGLHNRLSWNIYSADCLDTNPDVHIILYIIGFNFFELVNDTYGHLVGDRIIKELGRRLKSLKNDYIRAYRLGGDEFMISCVDIKQRFDEAQFANLLINLLDRSYEVDDDLIHVTTSIGSASYP
ncbi:MAG: GGDEF domain-containing protein, partial [Lachnospiraceae bacterium]|nr:GGDEF domain-containing protein [Lachnospiraceae bacterium]